MKGCQERGIESLKKSNAKVLTAVGHIDAKLIARQSAAGMAGQPGGLCQSNFS